MSEREIASALGLIFLVVNVIIAGKRGRNRLGWGILGLALPLISTGILLYLEPLTKR